MKFLTKLLLSFTALILSHSVVSAEIVIAVVGKTKNDSFYEQSFNGCLKFAQKHIDLKCLYDGPADYQDVRGQITVVNAMIKSRVDGILISTTDSNFLVKGALKLANKENIPVMTFDSDLLPEHREYRLAYVGTDNFDFGAALGHYAKKHKTKGITEICIQSGHKTTPNLNERIAGVRFALSGNKLNIKLNNINGWQESARCPFYTMGQRSQALDQLEFILTREGPIVFLAVAGFAQFSRDYIKKISPYKEQIISRKKVIISADTEKIQLEALSKNLSTINIGQRPFEMGRLGTELLYDYIINNNLPKQELNFLDYHYCTSLNTDSCIIN